MSTPIKPAMTAAEWDGGWWRGHKITCDDDGRFRYYPDGVAVDDDLDRPCGLCGLPRTPEGHDPCLANLPGVANACCGHGEVRESYVQFTDGRCIRGFREHPGSRDGWWIEAGAFTWADVDMLREPYINLPDLADRIAALLPPRET